MRIFLPHWVSALAPWSGDGSILPPLQLQPDGSCIRAPFLAMLFLPVAPSDPEMSVASGCFSSWCHATPHGPIMPGPLQTALSLSLLFELSDGILWLLGHWWMNPTWCLSHRNLKGQPFSLSFSSQQASWNYPICTYYALLDYTVSLLSTLSEISPTSSALSYPHRLMIIKFIHLFNKYLPSTYYVSSTALDVECTGEQNTQRFMPLLDDVFLGSNLYYQPFAWPPEF